MYINTYIFIYIYSQTPQIRNPSNPKTPLIRNYFLNYFKYFSSSELKIPLKLAIAYQNRFINKRKTRIIHR